MMVLNIWLLCKPRERARQTQEWLFPALLSRQAVREIYSPQLRRCAGEHARAGFVQGRAAPARCRDDLRGIPVKTVKDREWIVFRGILAARLHPPLLRAVSDRPPRACTAPSPRCSGAAIPRMRQVL